jgi:predicted metalloendopeptidase
MDALDRSGSRSGEHGHLEKAWTVDDFPLFNFGTGG